MHKLALHWARGSERAGTVVPRILKSRRKEALAMSHPGKGTGGQLPVTRRRLAHGGGRTGSDRPCWRG